MIKIGRIGDSDDDEEEEEPAAIKKPKAGKTVTFQKQPLPPIPRKKTANSKELVPRITKADDRAPTSVRKDSIIAARSPNLLPSTAEHDKVATKVLQDFKAELLRLTADIGSARNKGGQGRSAIADYLTDKYLSQRLDLLPTSSVVSRIRREVAGMIEQFIESPRASELHTKSSAPAILEGAALSTAYTDLADQVQHSHLFSASAPDVKAVAKASQLDSLRGMQSPIVLSENDEKQRIKKQYAEYLKLKRGSRGVIEQNEGETEVSLETTVADIKSLLSSLSLRKTS